jgi:hypothetical protein
MPANNAMLVSHLPNNRQFNLNRRSQLINQPTAAEMLVNSEMPANSTVNVNH